MFMENESIVKVVDRVEDAEGKTLLVGFPDVGLVGAIATSFLIDKLKLREVGQIESDELPPIVAIHDTKVKELIRIYEGEKILVLFSEVPIPILILKPVANVIVSWAGEKKLNGVLSLSGVAEPRRLDIESPKIYIIGSTSNDTEHLLGLVEAEALKDGYIVGMNAELLREGIKTGVNVGVILAQSHYNYPDPGAAAAILKKLPKIIGVEVDVNPLLESAEAIKIQMRDLMRRTSETMRAMQKSKELELPPVYM